MGKNDLIKHLSNELSSLSSRATYLKENLSNSIYHTKSLQDSLDDLTKRQIKLKDDIRTLEDNDSTCFETLKVKIDKVCRDFKILYDNFMLEKEIIDKDNKVFEETINDFKAQLTDFKIEINITELKSDDGRLYANREILIKNIKSGVSIKYEAGFDKSGIWSEKFKNDMQNNRFKWFKER